MSENGSKLEIIGPPKELPESTRSVFVDILGEDEASKIVTNIDVIRLVDYYTFVGSDASIGGISPQLAERTRRAFRQINEITSQRTLSDILTSRNPQDLFLQHRVASLIGNIIKDVGIAEEEYRKEIESTRMEFDVTVSDMIPGNPLNDYISVVPHIKWSLITEEYARSIQSGQADIRSGKTIDGANMAVRDIGQKFDIASTGQTHERLTGEEPVYYIQSLQVDNLLEPTRKDPMLGSMITMKMVVEEPQGMSLRDHLHTTALDYGWDGVNVGRIIYLIEIWWSGYDFETGEFVEKIPLGDGVFSVIYPVAITAFEADVQVTGTRYSIDFAPMGHFAYRPEDLMMESGTLEFGTTFGEFLDSLSTHLEESKKRRTRGRIKRKYRFEAPDYLLNSPFMDDENTSMQKKSEGRRSITISKDIDILTTLTGAISNTIVAQRLGSDVRGGDFLNPVILFTVKFHTEFSTGIDREIGDYVEITHIYEIVPFISFKHGPVTPETMNAYMAPENQVARLATMASMGMIRRVYDYINVGDNTEVIDMKISLNNFYFRSINTVTPNPSLGRYETNLDAISSMQRLTVNGTGALIRSNLSGRSAIGVLESFLGKLKPFSSNPTDTDQKTITGNVEKVDNTDAINRHGGGFGETVNKLYTVDTSTTETGDDTISRSFYQDTMFDYLSAELISLDYLEIRGDPIWLFSTYASIDMDGNVSGVSGRLGSVVYVRAIPSEQDQHMNTGRTVASDSSVVLGGFYQVYGATTVISDGRFTQRLSGTKIANLNLVDRLFDRNAEFRNPVQYPQPRPANDPPLIG